MLGDNPLHQHGLHRDLFEDMEIEEIYMLATIAHYYIKEKEQDLKANEQSQINSGFTTQEYTDEEKEEADRLAVLFYERRNGQRIAKEAVMQVLAKHKNVKLSKMIAKMKKEREEKK